jgi:two-component system, LytTR family, response regulator
MKSKQNEIGQLCTHMEILTQEITSQKHLLEEFLKNQTVESKQKSLTKILVKSNGRLMIVPSGDIDWIEAWGDYVRIHCKDKSYIVRQKIGDLEIRLDKQRFLRIGRSAIINTDRIKEMEPLNHGDYLITLYDNTQLNLSRNYRDRLSTMFDHHP